jgi:hypothetical protein
MTCPVCGFKGAGCATLAIATPEYGWCPNLEEFLGRQARLRAKWWRENSKDKPPNELFMPIRDWAEKQRAEELRVKGQERWEREQGY